jgi:hypothetical protein
VSSLSCLSPHVAEIISLRPSEREPVFWEESEEGGHPERRKRLNGRTKPFSLTDEASLKPRSAPITRDQTMESIMLAFLLNAIYRQFLRTSLSGAKIAGAWQGQAPPMAASA